MSAFETSYDTEESPWRDRVDLRIIQPQLPETEDAHAFIDNLHRAEDSRLENNPPFGIQPGFAQELKQWDILCLPKPKNKIRTAHSLGDEGTTVFISEFGELVSISKYLGLGMLGTILVEPPVPDYLREDEFNNILDGRYPGVGLRLKDRKQSKEQKIDYVHDRWPRASYKVGILDIKVQFMVHQGVVAQQYLINNSSQAESTCVFKLDLGFGARPSPVETWWENDCRLLTHRGISLTAGGHAAMIWAGDGRGQVQLDVVLFQDGRSQELNLSEHKPGSSESVDDSSLNQIENYGSQYHLQTVNIGPGGTQELTALYSLDKYSLPKEQEQTLQPKHETAEDNESGRKQAAPEDVINESQSIRSGIVRKPTDEGVVTAPNDTANNRSKDEESAQEDSFWKYDGDDIRDDLESRTNEEYLLKLDAEIPGQHFFSPGPQYIDVSMLLKDSYHGNWAKKFTTPTSLLLRRHLQQLLFVNSVSIPRPASLRSAIVFCEAHIIRNKVPVWGSLCMFRFLLSMYACLDWPEVVEPTLCGYLKHQIKDKCERHLDWIFDVSRPFRRGWATDYNFNGSYFNVEESYQKHAWYYGAVQFIKLYEFQMVFQLLEDRMFVLHKLGKRLGPWFESLEKSRDPKSDMWISRTVHVNIDWLDPQYRQDESGLLPEYIVADLIILWKALSFVFGLLDYVNLTASSLANSGTSASATSEMYKKLDILKASLPSNWRKTFSLSKLRKRIMDHLIYDNQDPKEPGAHTKDTAAQEGHLYSDKVTIRDNTGEAGPDTREAAAPEDIRSDKDTVEGSTKRGKDLPNDSERQRKEFDLVRKLVLVFRWAGNDKPRILWYSWASPILDAADSGFFKSESSSRVWKNTLEAQRVHQELSWKKVERYALALRVALQGQSLDETMNAEEMRKRVLERLLDCFYSNGTFPTLLDLTTKQPTSKWWDYNWSESVFDTPLLLLQEGSGCLDVAAFLAKTRGSSRRNPIPPNLPTLRHGPDTNSTEGDLDFDPEVVAKERAKLAKSATHSARSTKIDRANIVEPPDFEPDWLFPYPDCFTSDASTGTYETPEQVKTAVEELRNTIQHIREPTYEVLKPGIHKYLSTETRKINLGSSSLSLHPRAVVVDVRQASYSKGRNADPDICHLFQLLSKRTLKTAKKRLTIINSCIPEQALLLYLGSAESEKISIAGFLTRHKMREDFMRDHAHKAVNLWTTELHLSFYKKITITSDDSGFMPTLEESIFEVPDKLSAFPGKSKPSPDKLQKGAIGWRFSGDLHDRRWTGTILAFVPGSGNAEWITVENLETAKGFRGQRKIIEARLFSEMTKTIHVSTKEILKGVDEVLEEGEAGVYRDSSEHHDPFSESFDKSYSRSQLYLQLSDFLSHLDNNFKSTMETIEAYMDRERQRQAQPRWSIDDERQHRPELQKWEREGKRNAALVRSVRNEVSTKVTRVQHLRESLNADMQLREARLQARSAEDVRLFTYVTIVFLPISFISSLFSMSHTPNDNLVGTFAKVAVIALVITLVILFNLKTMSRNIWTYVNAALHKISDTMKASRWSFWRKTHVDLALAEKRNIQSDEPVQIRRMSKWWYYLFLLAFVLLEFPAIRVQLACDAFPPPPQVDPKQPKLLRKILRVILGLLLLPPFVFVYTIHFLLRNFIDLYRRYEQTLILGSKTSTGESKDFKKRMIKNTDVENDNKGAAEGKKAEKANVTDDTGRKEESIEAYRKEFNARVARLAEPPRLFNKGAADKGKDQDLGDQGAELEGRKDLHSNTRSPIVRTMDKLRWKASPKKESQTAEKDPDLEFNVRDV